MANGLFNLKQVIQAVQQGGWPNQRTPSVEYLVVAGGGGAVRGGGGAGGLLTGLDPVPNGQTILVTVGAGGTGRAIAGTTPGGSGGVSVFGSISSAGGGGGGTDQNILPYAFNAGGQPGGSGGGGGATGSAGLSPGGQGVAGQGNAGGTNSTFIASPYPSGGGGGAGTVGLNAANANVSGNGGAGIASAINGTVTTYAGGGGGGNYDGSGTAGTGGVGGGGNGNTGGSGVAGTANTGGGGGGGISGANGGNGGSGIVIVSYPDVYAAATATTGSPTVSTSGSGSISFNGTSQFVGYANNAALQLTGDFTIEGWFYITASTGANQVVLSKWNATSQGYILYYNQTQSRFYFNSTAVQLNGSATQSFGQYYHIAITRSGNNYALYINGTSVATTTSATTATDSGTAFEIGRNTESSIGWTNGYISNVRIVKGTAVYTGNFTPSTTPLTAITNTSLLLNTVSGAPYADGSTNSFATTTATSSVGLWNASSPFTGTGYKNRVYTWTSSGSITF
jgi:hypothetical protein